MRSPTSIEVSVTPKLKFRDPDLELLALKLVNALGRMNGVVSVNVREACTELRAYLVEIEPPNTDTDPDDDATVGL